MPKATTPIRGARRHNPLEDDLVATGILRTKNGKRKSRTTEDEEENENFVDAKASKNILRIGRELAEEEAALGEQGPSKPAVDFFSYDSRFPDEEGDEKTYEDEEEWGDDDDVVEEIEVDPDDLDTYRKFMPEEQDDLLDHGWDRKPSGESAGQGQGEGVNLADLILEKIAQHEAQQARKEMGALPEEDDYELPPKVIDVYTK